LQLILQARIDATTSNCKAPSPGHKSKFIPFKGLINLEGIVNTFR